MGPGSIDRLQGRQNLGGQGVKGVIPDPQSFLDSNKGEFSVGYTKTKNHLIQKQNENKIHKAE